MDRRKNSLTQTRPEADVNLVSGKAASSLTPASNQNASFYEINIQSSVDYCDTQCGKSKAKRKLDKVKEEEKKSSTTYKTFENPFMDSYYPSLRFQPELNRTSQMSKKIDSDVQTELELEKTSEKAIKDNQIPSTESSSGFRNQLKNYIIENFMSTDDSKMKGALQDLVEKDKLHIHHHEHHHYYYFDDAKSSEKPDSLDVKSSAVRSHSRERKFAKKLQEFQMNEPKQTYYFNWSGGSNLTFTKTSIASSRSQTTDSEDSPKLDLSTQTKGRFSNSLESILNRKSDFITTHIYSDSELTKRNSEEVHVDETNSQSSVNGAGSCKAPTVPASENPNVPSSSSVRKASDHDSSLYETQDEDEDEETDTDNFAQIDKIRKALPFTSLKTKTYVVGDRLHQAWTAKLRAELKDIKRELGRIEKKHLERKKSYILHINGGKKVNDGNMNKVFVYSSKTFILTPGNVLKKPAHKTSETLILKRKRGEGHHLEKEHELDSKKIYLKEQSICRQQQVYLVPNKYFK